MKIRIVSLVCAGLIGLPLASLADEAQDLGASQHQMVARDAKTGRLRPPTAEERQTMQKAAAAAKQGGPQPRRIIRHSSGAVGVQGSDELASYVVVGRQPDGQLVEACIDSKSKATEVVLSGAMPAAPQQPSSK